MQTAESILAKFDVLIEKLEADAAKEKRQLEAAARAQEAAAEAAAAVAETAEAEATKTEATEAEAVALETATKNETETQVSTQILTEPAEPEATAIEPETAAIEPETAAIEPEPDDPDQVLRIRGLAKHFGDTTAVAGIDLSVRAGEVFGIVGPNGAGKTTTLSMIAGLLRPDAGTMIVHGQHVWRDAAAAKRHMGVLPDRVRLFDRLTGAQFLFYVGVLRGLPASVVRERTAQLAATFGLEDALGRLVADYSAGMTKKISLAAALIHSPRLLVLDEPFESVDPVSVANIIDVLRKYASAGGTVILSSHSMELIERTCDSVAIIVDGDVLASGSVEAVRGSGTLEERFVELADGVTSVEGLEWLHSFSD